MKKGTRGGHYFQYVAIIGASLVLGFFLGYSLKKNPAPNPTKEVTKQKEKDPWEEEKVYPYDNKRTLIIQYDDSDGGYKAFFQEWEGERRLAFEGVSLFDPMWSQDGAKVVITHHISNENRVFIIDYKTAEYVEAEGMKQFAESQEDPGDYSHVYVGMMGWYDNEQLIVGVGGHPDTSSFRPKPQYYLINASTGKIVKRLL